MSDFILSKVQKIQEISSLSCSGSIAQVLKTCSVRRNSEQTFTRNYQGALDTNSNTYHSCQVPGSRDGNKGRGSPGGQ